MTGFRQIMRQFIMNGLLLGFGALITTAQTSIFFVPTTDTEAKKSVTVYLESYAHFDSYANGGFQSFGPSVTYGVRDDLEVGVNYYFTRDENGKASELQPNIKWKAYGSDKNGVEMAVGSILYIPLNDVAGDRVSAMFYANASKTIGSANGLRLTGGIYTMANTEQDFGTKTGALVGIEQPITKKLSFLADWTSGKNRMGYSNIGFGYETTKSQYLTVGYTFGNSGRANNFLSVLYGFTF